MSGLLGEFSKTSMLFADNYAEDVTDFQIEV